MSTPKHWRHLKLVCNGPSCSIRTGSMGFPIGWQTKEAARIPRETLTEGIPFAAAVEIGEQLEKWMAGQAEKKSR